MAAGVRDLPRNIELRGILWRGLVPFDVPPPGPLPTLEDVDPAEAAARLRRARAISAELAAAIATGNPAAIDQVERRPPRGGPRGTGRFASFTGDHDPGGGTSSVSWGPIGFPYIIRQVVITAVNFGAAGTTGEVQTTLHATGDDETGVTTEPAEGRIWPQFTGGTSTPTTLKVGGSNSNNAQYTMAIPVLDVNRFLTAFFVAVPAANTRASIGILIEEIELGAGFAMGEPIDLADLGRRYVGNPRPPQPRTPARRNPVGFTFQVRQGGQVLFSRTVPFSGSSAAEAGYNPVSGAANPGVIVHTDPSGWSGAFEAERARRSF